MATAEVTYALPEILRNSVAINPRTTADGDFSYVLFGLAERTDGRQYLVKSTVNHFADNRSAVQDVEIYDILKGIKARKMEAAQNGATSSDPEVMRGHTDNSAASISNASGSTISVAELLEIAKENYPELLHRGVREHFGIDTPPQGPNARYSIVEDPAVIEKLESDEYMTVYKAMVLIDGKYTNADEEQTTRPRKNSLIG